MDKENLAAFKETLYRTGGNLIAAIDAIDPVAAAEYRGVVTETVQRNAVQAAASYAPNIAAVQLRSMGIEHPLN